jgi:signal peptidase I
VLVAFYGIPGLLRVSSGEMANTILPGDLVVTFSRLGTIRRGDVVVHRNPKHPNAYCARRVIALPGESIQLVGTSVLVNGSPVPERRVITMWEVSFYPLTPKSADGSGPYTVYYPPRFDDPTNSMVPSPYSGDYGIDQPFTLPSDCYFVLSDNRLDSIDSRYWGPVPLSDILARPGFVCFTELGGWGHVFKQLD